MIGSMSAPYIVDLLGNYDFDIVLKMSKIIEMIIIILIIIMIGSMSAPYIVDIQGNHNYLCRHHMDDNEDDNHHYHHPLHQYHFHQL